MRAVARLKSGRRGPQKYFLVEQMGAFSHGVTDASDRSYVDNVTAIDQLLESESPEAKEFGHRMLGVVNDAAIALLLSIGHQTGLFDRMASLASATSAEIASAAGLDERYVREWLGGMVCAAIIDYDSTTHTYHLPADHASALARRRTRQCRQDGSVHRASGRGRAAHRRLLPQRRGTAVQRVSALSRATR